MKPEDFGIYRYGWNNSRLDCFQDVNLSNRNLTELPFDFGTVDGDFYCYYNKLTTLKGSPKEVNGSFHCYNNNLTSLKGCPEIVNGNFWCNHNKLTSLKYITKKIGGKVIFS